MKNCSYKLKLFLQLTFLFLTFHKVYSNDLVLIKPSLSCQTLLKVSFSDLVTIKNNIISIKFDLNDSRIKKNKVRSVYDIYYLIQGKDSQLIISKEKNKTKGIYTIPNSKFQCRGSFVLNSTELTSEIAGVLNSDVYVNDTEVIINSTADISKSSIQIKEDNDGPVISAYVTLKDELTAIVEGTITDNVKVTNVIIDKNFVTLKKDGTFYKEIHIERDGTIFEIVALDLSGNKTSKSFKVIRPKNVSLDIRSFEKLAPKIKLPIKTDRVAIIIGIENYRYTNASAFYADKDAQKFYDFANYTLGIPKNNIIELINDKGTRREILSAAKKWLKSRVITDKSEIYIFFAGHGLGSDNGKVSYLLPYDGDPVLLADTSIKRVDFFKIIKSSKPKNVFVFLDTCYSGTTRGTDMLIASRPIAIVAKEQAVPDNFTVFTAAAGDQTAKPLEEAKHGMFSYFLMKGMEGEADSNKDNSITASELHAYVQKNVIQHSSGSQTPELQGDANRVLVRF